MIDIEPLDLTPCTSHVNDGHGHGDADDGHGDGHEGEDDSYLSHGPLRTLSLTGQNIKGISDTTIEKCS